MIRNDLTAGAGVSRQTQDVVFGSARPQNLEDESREPKQKRTGFKGFVDKFRPSKAFDKQRLHTSQGMFWQLQREEQDFFPLVLLNIHAYISNPKNILGNQEKYKACDWLHEFQTATKTTGVFSFQPESFQLSLLKFNEAPGDLITILEQYNSDIRTRDVAEEMVKYAMRSSEDVKTSFCSLMGKIAKAIDNPRAQAEPDLHISERMFGLKEAHRESEKPQDARGAADEQEQVSNSRDRIRKFLEESMDKDDGVEASRKFESHSILAQVTIVPEWD